MADKEVASSALPDWASIRKDNIEKHNMLNGLHKEAKRRLLTDNDFNLPNMPLYDIFINKQDCMNYVKDYLCIAMIKILM